MPELIHVNSDSKLNQLNDIHSKKAKLVKYYMDGCGHCINLEPVWNSVETKIQNLFPNDDSAIISLNEKFMHKSKLPKVTGFPTISFIKDNKKIDHEGERTEKAILDFYKKNIKLKKTLEEKVIKLNKEKISSIELIDQALEEIKILRNNVIKENKSDV